MSHVISKIGIGHVPPGDAADFAASIVDTMRDPLLVLDADLRVVAASGEFYRTFSVEPEETIGSLVYDLGNRQWDIPALRDLLENILPQQATFRDFEVEHVFEEIGRRVMLLNARQLRRTDGRPPLILLVIEDATARRDAEEARRDAEARFTEMVANVRDHSIFLTDPDGVITSWNVAAERIMGYTSAEAVGRHFSLIFRPEDIEAGVPAEELEQARETGRAEDERWHRRKNGELFWALGIVTPLRGVDGCLTGFSKILRDMTERKRADDATRSSEEKYRSLIERMGDAHCILDREFRILRVNAATERLLGVSRSTLIGRSHWDAFPASKDAPVGRAFQRVVEEGIEQHLTHHYTGEGHDFHIELDAYPTEDGGVAMFWRDVSERIRAEAALRSSEEKYKTLFNSMDEAYAVVDVMRDEATGRWNDFLFLEVNPAFVRQTGMDNPVGKRATQFLGTPNPRWAEIYGRVAETGEPVRLEEVEPTLKRVFDLCIFRLGESGSRRVAVLFFDITARKETEASLEAELRAVSQLRALADRLLPLAELPAAMSEVLETAISLHAADRGTVQIYDPAVDGLYYAATRGFDAAALAATPPTDRDFHSTCAAALRIGEPVLVPDIAAAPLFAGHCAAAAALDYRAAFSFPLKTRRGQFLGVLTVHFRDRREPSERELRWAALYTPFAAHLIEQRQAEEALRASEQRLSLAIEIGELASWDWDLQTGKVEWNDQHFLAQGYAVGEVTPSFEAWAARVHPEDRDETIDLIEKARDQRSVYIHDFRVLRPGNDIRWCSARGRFFYDADGAAIRMIGVMEDVTDRKRTEIALRESDERLRLALGSARMGTWTWNATSDSQRRDANLNALIGLPATETVQPFEGFLAHVHPDDRTTVQAAFEASIRNGQPLNVEFRVIHQSGEVRWLRDRGDVFGGPVGGYMAGACVDITERKLAELALQESEKRLKSLNSALDERVREQTQELRNREERLRNLAAELIEAEQRERKRLAGLLHDHVQQYLVAAKMRTSLLLDETGTVEPAKLDIMRQLLDDALKVTRSMVAELVPPLLHERGLGPALKSLGERVQKQHELLVSVKAEAGANPTTEAMRELLYQVAQELLLNVVKHAATDVAWIDLQREKQELKLTVRDLGVGLDLSRIEEGGTFGLSHARRRVEQVGGRLEIESGPDRGTRITIVVSDERHPRHQGESVDEAHSPPSKSENADGKLRVVVVDDHAIVRSGVIGLLSREANIVIVGEAADGEAAVEVTRRLMPDVVVMDINMPRMNGIEATRRIKAEMPHVQVVAFTLHNQPEMIQEVREAGASGYVAKDAPVAEIIHAIQSSMKF